MRFFRAGTAVGLAWTRRARDGMGSDPGHGLSYSEPVGRPLFRPVNVEETLLPSRLIAAMQTMMIRANIKAYSVAVGPSSLRRK